MAWHEIEAPPFSGPLPTLRFAWNEQTGEIAGQDAERVRHAANEARRQGVIDEQPMSSAETQADPFTTYEGMAALLAFNMLRRPPDWLAEWLPDPFDEGDPDEESDLPIVH